MNDQKKTNIPESWSRTRLADICEIVRGVTYKKALASESPMDGHLPILRATNIQENHLVLDKDLIFVPQDFVSEKQQLREGDIVVATSSGSKHLVGKTAQVKKSWSGSFGAFCAAIRPSSEIDHHYLGYFFESREYKDFIAKQALGVNINNLRRRDLEEISVPIAPLEQQKRIVAEIEKQFSRLDEAVANLQRVKANLKRYKAAVLKAAVEGRLVDTEAELARRQGRDFETGEQFLQRILKTRRSQWQGKGKYKEPAAPDTTGLPELPEGWGWASPDQLSDVGESAICAGPFGTIFKAKDFRLAGIPIIFLRHVAPGRYLTKKPGFMDEKKWEELFQPYSVYGGELLITKLGEPPGVCAIYPTGIGPAMVTPDVIKMSVNMRVIIPRYLMHYFNSIIARQFSTGAAFGTTRLRLTIPIFRSMPLPLPPSAEQHRIVTEVDRRLSLVREVEAQVETNLKRAERLRQSILQQAFTGRLVSSDPSDESACGLPEGGKKRDKQKKTSKESVSP